ncbi:HIT family protein [Kurthia huakuii]|uniref:HIT family protein n=1 Tax=Kurthia huakuii TaxID=1421019 RepID=UPI00049501E1|nr:HIT family protein [Kurthia huakuii]MBM7699435.1 histidine triad (HIT) family protein [Kurthia huakuii]
MHCIFCNEIKYEQILVESKNFKVVLDIDPVQLGHLLIISKSHIMDLREINNLQFIELMNLEKSIIEILENHFSITSVSIIQNNGPIMDEGTHFHVHLIPRYSDDHFWDNQIVKDHKLSLQELKWKLNTLSI